MLDRRSPRLAGVLTLRLAAAVLACAATSQGALAQSFEETWQEFLDEDKVVRASALPRPDARTKPRDFNKYLLIYTNNDFCGGDVAAAEARLADIRAFDRDIHDSIPGFLPRLVALEQKVAASHAIDELWIGFLEGRDVAPADLDAVEGAARTCEKATAAKHSYMLVHHHLCAEDVARAEEVFTKRTLLLVDKTSLDVAAVEGLGPRVEKMRQLFAHLSDLDDAWERYLSTGTSPGFAPELPFYPCYPTPKIKELILRGLAAPCADGGAALAEIERLRAEYDLADDGAYSLELEDLQRAAGELTSRREDLETAWAHFVETDEVDPALRYGFEYCEPEPLIRAHILLGYSFACEFAEESVRTADSIRRAERVTLSSVVRRKLRDLTGLQERYVANGEQLESAWSLFVANDDQVMGDFDRSEAYCDMVQQVKVWTMLGLDGDCEATKEYLEKIEDFNQRFEFQFYADLECRVQRLRMRLYECRFAVVEELAQLEATADESVDYDARLATLSEEYGIGEAPPPPACE